MYLYTDVVFLLNRFLEMEECQCILFIIFQVNIVSSTYIPRFVALCFIVLHRRPSTSKKITTGFIAVSEVCLFHVETERHLEDK